MIGHKGSGLPLEGPVGGRHGGVVWERWKIREERGVDHGSEGEVLEKGEDEVGQGVHREVRANWRGRTRGLPAQGHNIGGEACAKGTKGIRGPRTQQRGEGPAEAGRGGVDRRRGARYPERGHAAFVGEKNVKWRETGLGRKNRNWGGSEAIGYPPLYLPPMNVHFGKEAFGGYKQVGPVRKNRKN